MPVSFSMILKWIGDRMLTLKKIGTIFLCFCGSVLTLAFAGFTTLFISKMTFIWTTPILDGLGFIFGMFVFIVLLIMWVLFFQIVFPYVFEFIERVNRW